ncbi:MAG: type III pantothenate kinase [Bdellovibrio sp.]|nr:type III pantothenate kinase [Bdellovibrio sp.]
MKFAIYTLDLGNSHPCVGEFINNELKQVVPLAQFLQGPRLDGSINICAEVRPHLSPEIANELNLRSPMDYFSAGQFFNMPVHYATTLGSDRLVQAHELFNEFFSITDRPSNKTVQLIDSGTFTTVDLITEQGFEGGHIIPGLNLLARSFEQGAKLSALSLDQLLSFYQRKKELPQTTPHAMGLGVWKMMEGFFSQWFRQYCPDKIILTGGQAQNLRPLIQEIITEQKSPVTIEVRQHLIHYALLSLAAKMLATDHPNLSPAIKEPLCPTF